MIFLLTIPFFIVISVLLFQKDGIDKGQSHRYNEYKEVVSMYDARGIAIIVIEDAKEKGKEISNLQLQKILYYIQKRFLKEYGICCFKNDIIAWKHGPVVREVYDLYKEFGSEKIPSARKDMMKISAVRVGGGFKPKYEVVQFEERELVEKHSETILKESEKYYDLNPWELVELSHQEVAWKETEQSEVITVSKIRESINYKG